MTVFNAIEVNSIKGLKKLIIFFKICNCSVKDRVSSGDFFQDGPWGLVLLVLNLRLDKQY